MRTNFGVMGDSEAIIMALGGTGAVAGALGQSKTTVSSWRSRGIPAGHWRAVVKLASDLGKSEITLELLAALAARKLEEARA